ncbi:hypothetical protein B0H15DRAFT_804001 [Mycena belliarum]|uniref:Uncharacterized protein n=1 Tax=Mycena belliarum TaxID=1033014 RepID=A0AAD6TZ70_9AGAR|nr:hypothetical protein B0H15DRAFT_804001 [Mycena belliae]
MLPCPPLLIATLPSTSTTAEHHRHHRHTLSGSPGGSVRTSPCPSTTTTSLRKGRSRASSVWLISPAWWKGFVRASVRLPDYLWPALSDRQIEYLALCERLQNEGIEDSGLKPTSPSNKPNSYSHLLLLTNGFNLALSGLRFILETWYRSNDLFDLRLEGRHYASMFVLRWPNLRILSGLTSGGSRYACRRAKPASFAFNRADRRLNLERPLLCLSVLSPLPLRSNELTGGLIVNSGAEAVTLLVSITESLSRQTSSTSLRDISLLFLNWLSPAPSKTYTIFGKLQFQPVQPFESTRIDFNQNKHERAKLTQICTQAPNKRRLPRCLVEVSRAGQVGAALSGLQRRASDLSASTALSAYQK